MARIQLIEANQAPLSARGFYAGGDPGPITKALAQVPELLEVAMPFFGAALGPSFLTLRVKELVILRVSALLECQYCINAHTVVARDAGLTRDEVAALRDELPIDRGFTDGAELVLVRWVDAIATGRGKVDPDLAEEFVATWGDPAVVELTMLAGATMALNRFCSTLELPTADETATRLTEVGFPS